jgi:nucleoid-associated protein YgaU/chemotaxis signal transduction protein
MKDDLALLPFVPVPGAPELVLGVAEHRGELLPVLDLAALFGRQTPIGKKSRMMHLVNGDFHALVITDEVAGSRQLSVETQRQVPIALPHQVLYGCYLDAGTVRLILNVGALAVHFEKTAVRELVASLSLELMETAFETGSSATIESTQNSPVASSGPADREEERAAVPPVAETVHQPEQAAGQDLDEGTARDEQLLAHACAGDVAPAAVFEEERIGEDARAGAEAKAAAREEARQRIEAEKLRAEDEARYRAVKQACLKAEADAKAIEEKRAQEKAERLKLEVEALARAEAEARAQEEARRKTAEEAANIAADEAWKQKVEESRRQAEDLARAATAFAARRAAEEAEQQRAAEETERQTAEEVWKREEEAARQAAEQTRIAALKRGQYLGIAALIVFLLVLIYFFDMPKRPKPPESIPEKTEEQAVTTKRAPLPEKQVLLYLFVPPSKAIPASFVYTVVKGDNLWSIAKRFTGNPLNYPRVAKDNSIATPDLIFPGQKVHLVRQAIAETGSHGAAPSSD